ncbi:MAG TPA: protease pro-enzyme activation domain-containing protein [Opitutaceae bacterium]|jgi:kumamolisin|nr:protease pro-enzyme activation domain-containing protein [Opitutaceae bacterium]
MAKTLLALILLAHTAAFGADLSSARTSFPDSVRDVVADSSSGRVRLVRAVVNPSEASVPIDFVISLRLRNYAGLQAILAGGGTVSRSDMEANFLPPASEYDALCAWLAAEGFQVTLPDSRHSRVYARGTAAQIAAALQVTFGRVATSDGEFTAALSAPSLPSALSADVIGIDGLQPYIRMHPQAVRFASGAAAAADITHPSRAIPADLMRAYNVPGNLTGAGQTIAVFASTVPLASDLAAFDQDVGVTGNGPNFTVVAINGGPTATGPSAGGFNEVSLDTEWSSGIAPGANLVVYACPTGGIDDFMATCTAILNSGGVNILTSSFSNPEADIAPASLQACSELLAQMAAEGISVFHGAGDSGAYGSPEYPTTDPYVTALGGTVLTFDSNWNEFSEQVWPNTGGGYSAFFPRPVWQQGNGVPGGSFRCVPDAAAPSSMVSPGGEIYSFIVLNGATNSASAATA